MEGTSLILKYFVLFYIFGLGLSLIYGTIMILRILLGIGLFLSHTANSQQNIVSTGGDATSSSGSFSFSLGQVDFVNNSSNSGNMNQGLQQPIEYFILSDDILSASKLMSIYPNPFLSNITLNFLEKNSLDVHFQIEDVNGKILTQGKIYNSQTYIELEDLSEGIYIISIYKNTEIIEVKKIIKQ